MPGSETVTLTGQTIDKLIRAGDGDAALLYLYILKTHGQKSSSEAAIALDKSKGWVASAMAMLSRLGLVHLDEESSSGEAPGADASAISDAKSKAPDAATSATSDAAASGEATKSPAQFKEPRRHTVNEVQDEIFKGSDFSIVVDETQRRLGKILTEDDLLRLFGIYDNLGLPSEVIMQLITHCIKESSITGSGRAPSVRYIEKAAFTWEREGILTLEHAEEYLKALEEKKSARGKIKKILQIYNREFSKLEAKYVDDWISIGFEPEVVEMAYEINVMKKGTPTIPYIDGILKNWHKKGLHTAEQVKEADSGPRQNTAGTNTLKANTKPGAPKRGEPNREEMERMQRLLDKIKED